jgi:hypothetical protein
MAGRELQAIMQSDVRKGTMISGYQTRCLSYGKELGAAEAADEVDRSYRIP